MDIIGMLQIGRVDEIHHSNGGIFPPYLSVHSKESNNHQVRKVSYNMLMSSFIVAFYAIVDSSQRPKISPTSNQQRHH